MKTFEKFLISICLTAGFMACAQGFALAEDAVSRRLQIQVAALEVENTRLSQQYSDVAHDRDAVLRKLNYSMVENAGLRRSVSKERAVIAETAFWQARVKGEDPGQEESDVHYNLGVLFQQQNKPDQAIREFQMALKVNPDDADAHYNLALVYDNIKQDKAKAMEHYSRYLELKPEAEDAPRVRERLLNMEQMISR